MKVLFDLYRQYRIQSTVVLIILLLFGRNFQSWSIVMGVGIVLSFVIIDWIWWLLDALHAGSGNSTRRTCYNEALENYRNIPQLGLSPEQLALLAGYGIDPAPFEAFLGAFGTWFTEEIARRKEGMAVADDPKDFRERNEPKNLIVADRKFHNTLAQLIVVAANAAKATEAAYLLEILCRRLGVENSADLIAVSETSHQTAKEKRQEIWLFLKNWKEDLERIVWSSNAKIGEYEYACGTDVVLVDPCAALLPTLYEHLATILVKQWREGACLTDEVASVPLVEDVARLMEEIGRSHLAMVRAVRSVLPQK